MFNVDRLITRTVKVVGLLLLVGVFKAANAQTPQPWDTTVISWKNPTICADGRPITACQIISLRVEESATATGTFRTLATLPTLGTSYAHVGASAGQHCYQIRAESAGGVGVPSNVTCRTNVQPPGIPGPPTNLVVVEPIAFNVKADFGKFAFVRGTRAGKAKIGASCDESRVTLDGYAVISSPRTAVTPQPDRGTTLIARCG